MAKATTSIGTTVATIRWNKITGVSGYKVYKSTDLVNPYWIYTSDLDEACYVSGLSPNTQYTVYVSAYNSGGESAKTPITFTTLAGPVGNYKGYVVNGGTASGNLHGDDKGVDVSISIGNMLYTNKTGSVQYKILSMECNCTTKRSFYSYGMQANVSFSDGSDNYNMLMAHLDSFELWNNRPDYHDVHINASGKRERMGHKDAIAHTGSSNLSTITSNSYSVSAGDVVGYTGDTGNSTGPHLHFSIKKNGSNLATNSSSVYKSYIEVLN